MTLVTFLQQLPLEIQFFKANRTRAGSDARFWPCSVVVVDKIRKQKARNASRASTRPSRAAKCYLPSSATRWVSRDTLRLAEFL